MKAIRSISILLVFALCAVLFIACANNDENSQSSDVSGESVVSGGNESSKEESSQPEVDTTVPTVYINGRAITFASEGNTDLELLSVENGITISVEKDEDEKITVNGEEVEEAITLDVNAITRDDVIAIEITEDGNTVSHAVNLMPSVFPEYTAEGESKTDGDYYISTYDLSNNYIFKLNNKGELIFYSAITKTDENGNKSNTNCLDFRKQYTSDGEVRYTYMPYLADAFADGDCSGINPGCVVVMDESYNVIDEIYYKDTDGSDIMIDPHGFIWIDEGHYILTAYKQMMLDVPEDIGAVDNSADMAVLFIQEIKDGEVLWEFSSADYEQFLYESNSVNWSESTERCYDYVHFNSMDIDSDGNLLVSCRHLDAILKISRENGELMWQLGGDYDDFGLKHEQLFSYQHSIILTEDGSYMLFDNADTAHDAGEAEFSSIVRITVDEDKMKITDFVRYNVVEFYSIYMGAIRELDGENGIYLWSVGGNYLTDSKTPPEWSMVEYTEKEDGEVEYNFCFRFNEGTRRLYCANKCK